MRMAYPARTLAAMGITVDDPDADYLYKRAWRRSGRSTPTARRRRGHLHRRRRLRRHRRPQARESDIVGWSGVTTDEYCPGSISRRNTGLLDRA